MKQKYGESTFDIISESLFQKQKTPQYFSNIALASDYHLL